MAKRLNLGLGMFRKEGRKPGYCLLNEALKKTFDVFRAWRGGTRPTESGGGGAQRLLHQAEDWEFFLQ